MINNYPKNVLALVEKALYEDDGDAAMTLGHMYDFGQNGVSIDYSEAIYWYNKAYDFNRSREAQMRLGYFYLNDIGTKKNLRRAISYFDYVVKYHQNDDQILAYSKWALEEAKRQLEEDKQASYKKYLAGDGEAAYHLARLVYDMFDMDERFGDWQELLIKGAKLGSGEANYFVYYYKWGNDDRDNWEYLLKAASLNYYESYFDLYCAYHYGNEFVKKDEKLALYYLKKLVEASKDNVNSGIGYSSLAEAYQNGELGLAKDYQKALYYYGEYLKINKLNHLTLHLIGEMYFEGGYGLNENKALAFDYFLEAATSHPKSSGYSGYTGAQVRVGDFYEHGYGVVNKDYAKAFAYYRTAADDVYSDVEGCYNTARCYQHGIGTKIDNDKAYEYASRGYEKCGDAPCYQKTKEKLQSIMDTTNPSPFGDFEI